MINQDYDVLRKRIAARLYNRGGGLLPGPVGTVAAVGIRARAAKLALFLLNRADIVKGPDGESCECLNCSFSRKVKLARHSYDAEVYETPWDDTPKVKHFCGDECREVYLYSGDFAYQECDRCGRLICQQNPRNGYMWQFRDLNDFEQVCLCCYEHMILEDGCDRAKFASGQLPGMFFDWGNPEMAEAGYYPVPGYENKFIRGSGSEACAVAVDLIDRGGKVICAYESMSICGGEGFISLYCKGVDLQAWADEQFNKAVNG